MDEDGFIRQRRNIIVVSLLLLFADTYGLTLSQELNLLGTKAVMTKSLPLAPVLGFAWAYLLLRYWQAFREQGEPTFSAAYHERVAVYLFKLGLELARSHVRVAPPQRVEFPADLNPMAAVHALTNRISGAKVRILYNLHDESGTGSRFTQHTREESFGFYIVIWARIRATLYVTFNTSVFTERYLPFVFAFVAIGHVIWKHRMDLAL